MWGEVARGWDSLALYGVCKSAGQGSNKLGIAVTPSFRLAFIHTLGAKGEAEAMFYVLEMEVQGKRREEWAAAVTQPEAY